MNTHQIVNDSYHKIITMDTTLTSQKIGFDYFHEFFVLRQKNIMKNSKTLIFYSLIYHTFMINTYIQCDIELKNTINS